MVESISERKCSARDQLVVDTVKPEYNDTVYNDKPACNDFFLSRRNSYLLKEFTPCNNENHFLDSPNDNFTSLECHITWESEGEEVRNRNLLQQGDLRG
ncbi:hypothetical protein AVEN_206765-1 [Araneus ventricosus]|uniref:Uncharacterized protein n=1 Tax=Araneus ventricosus TaxID=182803 RepID=A0A4Y2C6C9_ARAVE|nr:hypothetical protein AVEN_206765-1 [Araneus ventricosus]